MFFYLSFIRLVGSRQSYAAHQMIVCCAAYNHMVRRKQMALTDENNDCSLL